MNTNKLASEYLKRCKKRFKAVKLLFNEESYADVVREYQKIVELWGKGILRKFWIDSPKWHAVGDLTVELSEKYKKLKGNFKKYAEFSGWLRKERELAFYGEIDFISSERYTKKKKVKKTLKVAEFSIKLLERILSGS